MVSLPSNCSQITNPWTAGSQILTLRDASDSCFDLQPLRVVAKSLLRSLRSRPRKHVRVSLFDWIYDPCGYRCDFRTKQGANNATGSLVVDALVQCEWQRPKSRIRLTNCFNHVLDCKFEA